MDHLIRKGSVIEWSFSEDKGDIDVMSNFLFSVDKIPEYIDKICNMYHLMAIRQADYYLNLIYKKIEFEKLDISERYVFELMELYTQVALMLNNNSEAMIYAEIMKNISDNNISDKEYRYKLKLRT